MSDQPWMKSNEPGPQGDNDGEVGRVVVIGLLGGLLSAAGYLIYKRLPDEQKEKLHAQVRTAVTSRIAEFRENFNL
ncbi:MAG: hypothetical protein ACYDA1_01040 [Vulcanimicrobiaceae bacterium]